MISIPSLPATPPVANAATQQPSANSVSADDPNSFANYLKSIHSRQRDDETNGTSTSLSTGAKDKTAKDSKKSDDEKKKSALLTDTTAVPVMTATPTPTPKAFQLAWAHTNGNTKSENASSLSGSGAAARIAAQMANTMPGHNSQAPNAQADDSSDVNTKALKGGVSDAITNAPVAFGANLSKMDVLKADGIQGSEAKAGEAKASEARAKATSADQATQKNAAEISKQAENKASSGNQQHSDSSGEDQSAASGGVKAGAQIGGQSSAAQAEGFAAMHASATSSSNQTTGSETTVQSAYAPASASVEKSAPVTATAAVTEPAQTPTIRPQNIDLKIAGADNSQVDVRVSQRAGDVQVTVRTPDGDLAQSLRQHLPELSDRLTQAGVSGDLWQPQTAQAANTGGNDADSRYSDDAQTQQQNQQQHSRNNNSNQGGQQQGETPQSAWLSELNQANKGTN